MVSGTGSVMVSGTGTTKIYGSVDEVKGEVVLISVSQNWNSFVDQFSP